MPIADWADLMVQSATISTYTGSSAYGGSSYGTPVAYDARVIYKTKLVRTPDGAEKVSRGQVWLATVAAIKVQDQITLPDATTPTILTVEQVPDENGPLYSKVYF